MARGNGDETSRQAVPVIEGERERGEPVPGPVEPGRASVGRSLPQPTESTLDSAALAALSQFFELLDRWDTQQSAGSEPRK